MVVTTTRPHSASLLRMMQGWPVACVSRPGFDDIAGGVRKDSNTTCRIETPVSAISEGKSKSERNLHVAQKDQRICTYLLLLIGDNNIHEIGGELSGIGSTRRPSSSECTAALAHSLYRNTRHPACK